MQHYERRGILGRGAFGIVFEAYNSRIGAAVAVKRVNLGDARAATGGTGAGSSAAREVSVLQELQRHANVIELIDVFEHEGSTHLVFDVMATDLETVLLDKTVTLHLGHVITYLHMLLSGLQHIHAHRAVHRDIKPNNLLFSADGTLKIADFGLARFIPDSSGSGDGEGHAGAGVGEAGAQGKVEQGHAGYGDCYQGAHASVAVMSHQVSTRWYRPPELLFGCRSYDGAVDMWAVGCLVAEILMRVPGGLFPGESDLDQLSRVFRVLGTPTRDTWPDAFQLPSFVDFGSVPPTPLEQALPHIASAATAAAAGNDAAAAESASNVRSLLISFWSLDPCARCSAASALQHPFFSRGVAAVRPADLPLPVPPERLNGAERLAWLRGAGRADTSGDGNSSSELEGETDSDDGSPSSTTASSFAGRRIDFG
eukprot:g17.t1